MASLDTIKTPLAAPSLRTECSDSRGELALVRVVGGRAGAEYWTRRCTRCGGIHLDVVQAQLAT
jgi:hypothetical protein